MSLLSDGIAQIGLDPRDDRLKLLETFLAELELWNRRQNLVKASGEQLVIKHVLDSLVGVPIITALPHATVADVGSGAGFPGIPLAIFLEESEFSLIERSARRAAFLRNVITLLDLRERVHVIERDLERVAMQFSVVTLRAFRDLPEFAHALFAITEHEGSVVAFKGRRTAAERELASLTNLPISWQICAVNVPQLNEERHIVVMRRLRQGEATR